MLIKIYDTTLRDGAQREGISLTLSDKLKIVKKLDDLGFHYIEGGFPGSNKKDSDFFTEALKLNLDATLVAFGSTRKKGIKAEDDENLKCLLSVNTSAVCLVGKAWSKQVKEALKTTLEENLTMIADSIEFMKKNRKEVIFDAEHFFDGYKNDPDYALKSLKEAEKAGADWIVLCDTNGGTLPHEISKIIKIVKENIKISIGIHAHNDAECAVANSLTAVMEGAEMVQGTMNGYGERCGNANICSVIPNLSLKSSYKTIPRENFAVLMEASHFISEVANISPDNFQPYVGKSAFAHKAGLHVSAVGKNPELYEHINPALVGNEDKILISELAGRSNIEYKIKQLRLEANSEKVSEILKEVKRLENKGYHFEAAEGSLELLIRKFAGDYHSFFIAKGFYLEMKKGDDGRVFTEATVRVEEKSTKVIEKESGNGPVNALDKALRKAISKIYPEVLKIGLIDYKVRVLEENKGTGSVVRVLIESTDGERTWSTIGVSENIIEASWEALLDSINYGLICRKIIVKNII